MDNEQEIQAKGLTAPRVTPADVEAEIAETWYFTAEQGIEGSGHHCSFGSPLARLTFCVLTLRNGFTVSGESACASPENYNEELGQKIARAKAVEKIWPLLGFRLRDKLHAGAGVPEGTWQERLIGEHDDLKARAEKLQAFRFTEAFAQLDDEDAKLLIAQHEHMTDYLVVLDNRISRAQRQS